MISESQDQKTLLEEDLKSAFEREGWHCEDVSYKEVNRLQWLLEGEAKDKKRLEDMLLAKGYDFTQNKLWLSICSKIDRYEQRISDYRDGKVVDLKLSQYVERVVMFPAEEPLPDDIAMVVFNMELNRILKSGLIIANFQNLGFNLFDSQGRRAACLTIRISL